MRSLRPPRGEIRERYQKIATRLVNPEIIRFSQIFVSNINKDEAAQARLREKAEEAYRKLRQGEEFGALVTEYNRRQRFPIRRRRFWLSGAGRTHGPKRISVRSYSTNSSSWTRIRCPGSCGRTSAFHIVKVREHLDAKILKLDDQLSPTNEMTVREYISRLIISEKQQQMLQKAYARVVEELRREAEIQVF